jgi:hypothetical protein
MQLSCISLAEMLATQRTQTHGKKIGSIDRGLAHDLLYIHPTARDGMNGESNLGHPERARDPKCDETSK